MGYSIIKRDNNKIETFLLYEAIKNDFFSLIKEKVNSIEAIIQIYLSTLRGLEELQVNRVYTLNFRPFDIYFMGLDQPKFLNFYGFFEKNELMENHPFTSGDLKTYSPPELRFKNLW